MAETAYQGGEIPLPTLYTSAKAGTRTGMFYGNGLTYTMRATDALGNIVFWTAANPDPNGDNYSGSKPVSGAVVVKVEAQH